MRWTSVGFTSKRESKRVERHLLMQLDSMEESVRLDLNVLRSSALVRKELADCARGFVYNLKTGLLSSVSA